MSDLDRMKQALAKGGSVVHKGNIITSERDLPKAEDLASEVGRVALRARSSAKPTAAPKATAKPKSSAKAILDSEDEEEDEE